VAERRMFSMAITDSDSFIDMPQSSQKLYFHLSMKADDDGFVNKPKSVMRITGTKDDDLKLLIHKKFLIPFESGVVVIKHWKIHNYIAKDRYKETNYKEEKAMLTLDENKSYKLITESLYTDCIQDVDKVYTQVRIGKDRIGKDSIDNIVGYLNEKTNKNYKSDVKKTKDLIKARINEGFNEDDFYKVIDVKVKEWKGKEWEKFLRPETLFGPKFESYLNQNTEKKSEVINLPFGED
jgi:uncharacterized phage protein (TIGR02220 family)